MKRYRNFKRRNFRKGKRYSSYRVSRGGIRL